MPYEGASAAAFKSFYFALKWDPFIDLTLSVIYDLCPSKWFLEILQCQSVAASILWYLKVHLNAVNILQHPIIVTFLWESLLLHLLANKLPQYGCRGRKKNTNAQKSHFPFETFRWVCGLRSPNTVLFILFNLQPCEA